MVNNPNDSPGPIGVADANGAIGLRSDGPVMSTPTRAELIGFLQGRSALNGRWFADRIPGMPQYWWRGYLTLFSDPIPMVLHCPACGSQHIDAPSPGWDNPPHRSHLCGTCGCIWRPADVPTVGVASIITSGKDDTWPVQQDECDLPPPCGGAVFYEAPSFEELERRRLSGVEWDCSIRGHKTEGINRNCIYCGERMGVKPACTEPGCTNWTNLRGGRCSFHPMRDEGDLRAPPRLLPERLPAGCEANNYNAHDDEFPTGPC